jgi:hypothetical protein
MTQARLRMIVFLLWVSFWVVSTILLLLAPWLRTDKAIVPEQIKSAILSITVIWIPAVSCLAAFWFPQDEQRKARRVIVTKDKVAAAITLTVTYLLFVLVLITWSVYFIAYDFHTMELPEGASFPEQLSEAVKIALVVSPVALTPINWLTGGRAK